MFSTTSMDVRSTAIEKVLPRSGDLIRQSDGKGPTSIHPRHLRQENTVITVARAWVLLVPSPVATE